MYWKLFCENIATIFLAMISTEHRNKSLSVENRKINWTDSLAIFRLVSVSLLSPLCFLCGCWLVPCGFLTTSAAPVMCLRVVFRVASSKMAFNFFVLETKTKCQNVRHSLGQSVRQSVSHAVVRLLTVLVVTHTHRRIHSLTYISFCCYCCWFKWRMCKACDAHAWLKRNFYN